jgi:hypothetical protein
MDKRFASKDFRLTKYGFLLRRAEKYWFARGDFKLCKECLDKVREEHNLDKGL